MKEKERERITFDLIYADEFINDTHGCFDLVYNEIIETCRWTNLYNIVIQRKFDGKYFRSTYRKGATEYQDEDPWQQEGKITFTEAFPRVVTSVVYE